MAKMTIWVGLLLIVISVGFWLAMGRTEMSALHPAGMGVLLSLCGFLANTENAKQRMIWMHIAVTLGLIGFLITAVRAVIQVAGGRIQASAQMGFAERLVIAMVCLLFVAFCVRSFIAARKARLV